MKIIIFVCYFIFLSCQAYALPGGEKESIADPKEKLFSMVPPKTGGADCFLFRKKEEDGLKKFTQILNYLGCNIIKKPLDFCTCLDRLGAPPPLKFRDFPGDLVTLLGPDKIEDIELLKRKKKKFVSSLDVDKKKKSFQFDQLYCEALKKHKDQINKNTQLAISIMGRMEDLDEKTQKLKDKRIEVLDNINSNRKKIRELNKKIETENDPIKKAEFEAKKKELEDENIKKEKEVKKLEEERDALKERFQMQAHLLKLTKPLPLKVITKALEEERLKHLNKDSPKKEREYFYELVYLLGDRGDDASVSVLNSMLKINDKKGLYKFGHKDTEFLRVVRAIGIGRNPKSHDALEKILKTYTEEEDEKKKNWFFNYQKTVIQKSLGMILEQSDELLDKKLKNYEELEGKAKNELLMMLTYVKHPRVGELLEKVKKDLSDLDDGNASKKSDYLEDLIERGIMRNSKKKAEEYLAEIINVNTESQNSRVEAMAKAEALLDVGHYDVLVKLIEKNKSDLGEDKTYFNGLVKTLVEKVNDNSRFIKEEDRKKIGQALRGMENDSDPKISNLVKKTLLQIGDTKEITKVRESLNDEKERNSALTEMQHIRAQNKYAQQEVIKDYRKAIKEEGRPKKNETKKEKKERLDRVVKMKKTFLGQADQFQKEAIKKAKETKTGKTLESLRTNVSNGKNEEDFYNDFEPSRPESRKRLGVVLDDEEKEKISWGPRPKKTAEEKKEEVLVSDDTKERIKIFGPDKAKLNKFLKLHPSTLKPLESFKTKRQLHREISTLKEDLTSSKSALASSFGSRRGEEFWKDNNIEDRLMDSRRDAFRKQKTERESERSLSHNRSQKEGPQQKSKSQSSSSGGNFNAPSSEPRTISPKSSSSSSRPRFISTNSSLLPGSSSSSRQTETFEESSVLESKSEESSEGLSLSGSSISENKVKEENYRILLIKKSSTKDDEKSEGPTFRVSEKFLSLSQSEKDKVLLKIFKKRKENTLLLKTSSGILIRVQRNTVYKKSAPEETFHEKREKLGTTIVKKEKRLDDLYSKLKSFLQKSKRKAK